MGVPLPGEVASIVAVNVTDWPTLEGLTDETNDVVESMPSKSNAPSGTSAIICSSTATPSAARLVYIFVDDATWIARGYTADPADVSGPHVPEGQFVSKTMQRDDRVLAGKLAQKAQKIGIIPMQFGLDLKIAQLRYGERGSVGLAQHNDFIFRQTNDLLKCRMTLGQVNHCHIWTSLSPMRKTPCFLSPMALILTTPPASSTATS